MLDLDLAGDFIVMAATLMQIKARMLLPRQESADGEEAIDPRTELTQRLLEYRRFKESAEELQHLELDQRERFFRALFRYDLRTADPDEDDGALRDVTVFGLIMAFRNAMSNIPAVTVHEVRTIPWSIEDQGLFLMNFFQGRKEYHFTDILAHMQERLQIVVTFIALLELIRAHRVRVAVQSDFNNFRIIQTLST
jgi:segregation and condensation protein A